MECAGVMLVVRVEAVVVAVQVLAVDFHTGESRTIIIMSSKGEAASAGRAFRFAARVYVHRTAVELILKRRVQTTSEAVRQSAHLVRPADEAQTHPRRVVLPISAERLFELGKELFSVPLFCALPRCGFSVDTEEGPLFGFSLRVSLSTSERERTHGAWGA